MITNLHSPSSRSREKEEARMDGVRLRLTLQAPGQQVEPSEQRYGRQ